MINIKRIIKAIDEFLEIKYQQETTLGEINPYLERLGLLNDTSCQPWLKRKILRKVQIPLEYQVGVNWQIPHSEKVLKISIQCLIQFQKRKKHQWI